MSFRTMALAAVAAAALAAPLSAQAAGDAVKGKATFNQQCALCHSAAAGAEGAAPSLFGVVGRKAASDAGYPAYSKALKASGLTWKPANLDTFLSGPAKLVPGTNMPITLADPVARQNVIAYLVTLKK